MKQEYRLSSGQLTRPALQGALTFESTGTLTELDGVIGQQRAVEAIEFGLDMEAFGYNILVSGDEGTGKSTIVRRMVSEYAAAKDTPEDVCLVHNFDDPFSPVSLFLPAGAAIGFQKKMSRFIEELKNRVPQIFEADEFVTRKQAIEQKFSDEKNEVFKVVEAFAAQLNMGIGRSDRGYQAVALHDGQPMTQELFAGLSEDEKQKISSDMAQVNEKLAEIVPTLAQLENQAQEALSDLITTHVKDLIANQMVFLSKLETDAPS